jgi:hypothetical protein
MGQDPQLGVDDLTSGMLDDYLLDVEAGTDATIAITSIEIAGGVATITVKASSASVDFDDINGTLVVLGTADLGTAFVEIGSANFNVTPDADEATVTVTVGTDKFLKAKVK